MSRAATNVLGLDVGARQIGVSVLKGEELFFYAIKSIRQNSKTGTLGKIREILTALVEKYEIEAIALKQVFCPQQLRSFVKNVYEVSRDFALEKNIRLFEYPPAIVRQTICQCEKPTKRGTALLLARRYVELARYSNVSSSWQKLYYAQLFESIAVGLVCAKELAGPDCFRQNP